MLCSDDIEHALVIAGLGRFPAYGLHEIAVHFCLDGGINAPDLHSFEPLRIGRSVNKMRSRSGLPVGVVGLDWAAGYQHATQRKAQVNHGYFVVNALGMTTIARRLKSRQCLDR